ncbi:MULTISPECIES: ABC transporter ATP-binding protein [Crateriforma]|uniref:Glycine betaine/carnitine/choline transport ATP-binding protein OpuCA n=1 Tax=Crateriforma conspicua TaxID=2527996 RepID=A0A5C6FSB0_9PLAN|nr:MULTISPECIES: ABC transporter ATP-binding protein [Crateriforma]TWU65221.1 Glycine betaine/carnitine/choline transport ATP-binding protein OpuCA [Crateriforma conspicua]
MIKTVDLTKKYGDAFAIHSIDLNLAPGDLFGFIGPNGAGKTTTMRIIATLLEPSWGEAYVCDHSVHTQPKEIRRLVGYMPDFFGVYDDMTVVEYLEFFAASYRIKGTDRRKRVDEMLDIVDLDFKRDAYANTLSRGQTQRLGLARTLLHDPQVLLLDEPLSGLDPRARIEMRNLLRKLGQLGKTIIVSSHILPELADVCNKVGIIDKGEMKQNATKDEVIRMVREHTVLEIQPSVRDQMSRIGELLEHHDKIQGIETGDDMLRVVLKRDVTDYADLPRLLIENGIDLKRFTEEELDLESAFMALTKGTSTRM